MILANDIVVEPVGVTLNTGNSNVTDFLLADKDPSRLALQFLKSSHTYGDLQIWSRAVSNYLLSSGAVKGDRAVLASDNSFFWVAAYLGILKAGLVAVPLPSSIPADKLRYVLDSTESRFAFLQYRLLLKHKEVLQGLCAITDRGPAGDDTNPSFADLKSYSASGPLPQTSPDDLGALMFTSGSTGSPRGVMISHRNIMANTESIIQYLKLTSDDRIMAVLPFHYCFGTSLLHSHLRAGGSLVVDNRFMYPEAVLQRMLDTQCTGFAGVPSHYQILLRNSSLKKKNFPSLRYVQQAGGHLAPTFVRELCEVLPNTEIFVMYGQTEATARLSYLPPSALPKKLGSIGKGMPGVTLQILKESNQAVRAGEVGEIVAEGENVALGYWRSPEESAEVFRDGRLHTGDLATIDEDGFIYIVDRAKDVVKCGGKRVSCRQVEEALLEFDELLEVAVIGIPDEVLGEAVKAFVVPRSRHHEGLEQRLLQFCKERIPLLLIPKQITVIDALPKNSAGKIIKSTLKSAKNDSF